jgi:hypothetical protein
VPGGEQIESVGRAPGVLWRELPGAVVILQPDDSVVRLTGPGALLWVLLDHAATIAELEDAFAGRDSPVGDEPEPAPGAGDQIRTYVIELRDLGLVTTA